jgi:RimJ/RimL family protein N-acetyltransferase
MLTESTLHTPRLALLPLSPVQLSLALQDVQLLAEDLGFAVVPDLVTPPVQRAITMKLNKISFAAPEDLLWYTYWLIVVKQVGRMTGAGMIGFKGIPDETGSAEIGYGIDPAFRSQGYMTEAVRVMIAWAFQHDACRAVTGCGVLKSNPASSKVLLKAGMTCFAEDVETFSYRVARADWHA